ncbi:hypothetical protein RHMOL_Rhmol07G0011200 [Rhododendron molle]|uniref:Uncharacterized protein n=1 Tax=Rhododendron molle TaxID=49168 RepID=A0ACC0MXJ7_RHOML|nr:hypothetical protein RHMOL_Rhmol07G0011200 [Rhododendron molle]
MLLRPHRHCRGEEDVFFSAVDTDDVLYIRLNMPGVSRDGLEVRFEPTKDKLVVIGKRVPDPNIAEIEVVYIVPTRFFCTERIEYTLKSGMLVLSIPKKLTGEVVSNDGFEFHYQQRRLIDFAN